MKTKTILAFAVVGLSLVIATQAKSSSNNFPKEMVNSNPVADSIPLKTKVIPAVKERRKKTPRFPKKAQ